MKASADPKPVLSHIQQCLASLTEPPDHPYSYISLVSYVIYLMFWLPYSRAWL